MSRIQTTDCNLNCSKSGYISERIILDKDGDGLEGERMGILSLFSRCSRSVAKNGYLIKIFSCEASELYEEFNKAVEDRTITTEQWTDIGRRCWPLIGTLWRMAVRLGWVKVPDNWYS